MVFLYKDYKRCIISKLYRFSEEDYIVMVRRKGLVFCAVITVTHYTTYVQIDIRRKKGVVIVGNILFY
jgi:hypothetical protein